MNDSIDGDERQQAATRHALARSEAARLGRELREKEARLALLPAYSSTSAFAALYSEDVWRRWIACRFHILLAIWDSKYYVMGWIAMLALQIIRWPGLLFAWVVLCLSTLVLSMLISEKSTAITALKGDLIEDLVALQPILGENPDGWMEGFSDKADLAGYIDNKLSTEVREAERPLEHAQWAAAQVQALSRRFDIILPKTKKMITNGSE